MNISLRQSSQAWKAATIDDLASLTRKWVKRFEQTPDILHKKLYFWQQLSDSPRAEPSLTQAARVSNKRTSATIFRLDAFFSEAAAEHCLSPSGTFNEYEAGLVGALSPTKSLSGREALGGDDMTDLGRTRLSFHCDKSLYLVHHTEAIVIHTTQCCNRQVGGEIQTLWNSVPEPEMNTGHLCPMV